MEHVSEARSKKISTGVTIKTHNFLKGLDLQSHSLSKSQ